VRSPENCSVCLRSMNFFSIDARQVREWKPTRNITHKKIDANGWFSEVPYSPHDGNEHEYRLWRKSCSHLPAQRVHLRLLKEEYPGLFPVLSHRSSLPTPRGPSLLSPAFGLNATCGHVEPRGSGSWSLYYYLSNIAAKRVLVIVSGRDLKECVILGFQFLKKSSGCYTPLRIGASRVHVDGPV